MSAGQLALLGVLAILIVLSRPWLEATRPPLSLPLIAGIVLGPAVTGVMPRALAGALEPAAALAGGWLVLLAAESFDVATLRRLRPGRLLLLICVPGMLAAGAAWLAASWTRPSVDAPLALLAACAAVALDPAAVRAALGRAARPDAAARLAPSVASLALGLALAASAFAAAPSSLGESPGASHAAWGLLLHGALTLLLGGAVGLVYVGPLRLAPGKGMLPALLASMALVGWGLARWLGMSPLAVLVVAGAVLANDGARRDLIATTLADLERPFTLVLLFLTGASAISGPGVMAGGGFWILAGALLIVRPLGWRLVPASGLTAVQVLPLSPLALLMAGAVSSQSSGSAAAAVASVFIASEMASIAGRRFAGADRPERTPPAGRSA